MNTGLVLALIAAVSFAVGIVLVRKTAGEAGEAFSVAALSVFTGIPLFAIAITVSGEWHNLVAISLKALVLLAATGIIHFIIGRLLAYDAFRLIGANRATPVTQVSPVFTLFLSWIFLSEKLTLYVGLGAACMMAGVFLVGWARAKDADESKKRPAHEVKGILMSLGAALCWGITAVLIKPAVEETGSAAVGSFLAYISAGIIMALLLFSSRTRRQNFARLSFKKGILPMVVAGLFTSAGQLMYFGALERSPANIIAPLISIEVLFIYALSFLVNRKGEVFTAKVALGMAALVAGTFLLFR